MKSKARSVLLVIAFLLAPPCLLAQDLAATLSIRGDIQKPVQWSLEALKTQFAGQTQDIKYTAGKDKEAKVGTGVPLLSVIQAAGPKTEKSVRHHDLAFMALVEAYDSYRVFFSLAELMPQAGNAQVYLIWNVDGKPLPAKEAPFRLVVLSDKGIDRYIYGVTGITLVDGVKLANQLKAGQ